ncbi:MAG TPA: hypothetical protein VKU85_11555 [bacterium]|nr:hypothetical protein [bacterium]
MERTTGPIAALLVGSLLLAGGCGHTNVNINREFDNHGDAEEYDDTMSPESFVDRLGEPDVWRNEGEGDKLRMTAIWYCLDDEYREVRWRIHQRNHGGQSWVVTEDIRRECGPDDFEQAP